MRLFVAIDLPDVIKDQLEAIQGGVAGATWVKRHAFHITLRFLGDQIPPERLNPIMEALDKVQSPPFEIMLNGVGRFPPSMRGAARVLWVGVQPQSGITELHNRIQRALDTVGFGAADHKFTAHVTLARLKTSNPTREINAYLERNVSFRTGPIRVSEFVLFSSVLTSQGARYKPEEVFKLGNQQSASS